MIVSPRDPDHLADLMSRIDAGAGADRDLDHALMALTYVRGQRAIGAQENSGPNGSWVSVEDDVWIDPVTDRWVTTSAFEFTSDLSLSLRLLDRLAPGAFFVLARGRTRREEPLHGFQILAGSDEVLSEGEHDEAPRSVLLALIRFLARPGATPDAPISN